MIVELAKRTLTFAKEIDKSAEVFVSVSRSKGANVRFARNEMTTSGAGEELNVALAVAIGRRHASTSTNQTDDASLRGLAMRAFSMAKLSPEDPEHVPLLPPQTYATGPSAEDASIAGMTPDARVALLERSIAAGDRAGVDVAGFLETQAGERAIASSTGIVANHRATRAAFTITARTKDGTGSGWGGRESYAIADLGIDANASIAIEKGLRSASAKPLAPGKYTVILEPQAVSELLLFLVQQMDARAADEGRSFFSKKIGEKLFADGVTLRSDPTDPLTPGPTFDEEGVPLAPRTWIENGRVKELSVSRYWAEKSKRAPTGAPSVYHLAGGGAESLEALVKGTKRGLVVTRFWYNRMLEPQSILVTGLTRDGVFLVEDGQIKQPVSNFRYNESPITMLANVEAMTKQTFRVLSYGGAWRVPALRVGDFTMASTSAAV